MLNKQIIAVIAIVSFFLGLLIMPGCPPVDESLSLGMQKALFNFGCRGCAPSEGEDEGEGEIPEGEDIPEGESSEGEVTPGEGEAEGEILPGEGEPEGEAEGEEGESVEGEAEGEESVYVWGMGDDWEEEVLEQTSLAMEGFDAPVNAELFLNILPEYSTPAWDEYEAALYLSNFAANVPGALYFSSFPSAAGNRNAKVWHMATHQYQVRLTPSVGKRSNEKASPDSAMMVMTIGSASQIPAGFSPKADLYVWRALPGRLVDEAGSALPKEKLWFNLTNGHSQFVYVNEDAKGAPSIYQSIHFPVGNHFDCPAESPVNYAAITTANQTPPQWQQDLDNNPATRGWMNVPDECPLPAPEGYRYEYQGHTVVVDMVTTSCTLPGLSDPDNPRDYEDHPNDVTLLHSTSTVADFVCENDVMVGHTWRMVPE